MFQNRTAIFSLCVGAIFITSHVSAQLQPQSIIPDKNALSHEHVSNKVEEGTYDYNIIEYQRFSVKNYKKWLTTIDQTKRF